MRSKTKWMWYYGITTNIYTFISSNGRITERTGYTPYAAGEFCDYLNSRG